MPTSQDTQKCNTLLAVETGAVSCRWFGGTHAKERTMKNEPIGILDLLSRKIVGQQTAIAGIASTVKTYQAGLAPAGRPAGVFLLLGPTGTGKTRTVEALAEILHVTS